MNKRKNLIWQLPFLTLLIVGTVLIVMQQRNMPYTRIEGKIFGTFYHITYQSDKDLGKEMEQALLPLQSHIDHHPCEQQRRRGRQQDVHGCVPHSEESLRRDRRSF